jgi:hypothetical protein
MLNERYYKIKITITYSGFTSSQVKTVNRQEFYDHCSVVSPYYDIEVLHVYEKKI